MAFLLKQVCSTTIDDLHIWYEISVNIIKWTSCRIRSCLIWGESWRVVCRIFFHWIPKSCSFRFSTFLCRINMSLMTQKMINLKTCASESSAPIYIPEKSPESSGACLVLIYTARLSGTLRHTQGIYSCSLTWITSYFLRTRELNGHDQAHQILMDHVG